MITTNDLVHHFSDLLDQLKKNELSSEKVRDLTLLYVKHKKETYDTENKKETENKEEEGENEKEDELKYFALGWYIHNFLIKNPINK
jgi:hypothetical protein